MRPKPGTCRVCGCTDEMGCAEGCEWADASLCTSLVCMLVDTLSYVERVGFTKGARKEVRRLLRRARKEARW